MPPKKKKAIKSKNGKKNTNPPESATNYSGPIITMKEAKEEKLTVMVLSYFTPVTSNSGGAVQAVFTQIGFQNSINYSSDVVNVYAECRVLGWQVQYFPSNRYSKTTTTCTPGVRTIDRQDGTALSSIGDGMLHDSWKIFSLEDPSTIKIPMNGIEESGFQSLSTITPTNWMKIYVSNLSVSTGYGYMFLSYRVQLRGHPS